MLVSSSLFIATFTFFSEVSLTKSREHRSRYSFTFCLRHRLECMQYIIRSPCILSSIIVNKLVQTLQTGADRQTLAIPVEWFIIQRTLNLHKTNKNHF